MDAFGSYAEAMSDIVGRCDGIAGVVKWPNV